MSTAEQIEKWIFMFQKQWRKFGGSFGDREPGGVIRVRATRSVAKKNGGKWTRARWLPEESLEMQLPVRNNDCFRNDRCGLVDAERC